MKTKLTELFAAFIMIICLCSCANEMPAVDNDGGMSIDEKIGQLFLVRCPEDSQIQAVMDMHPGGILMFKRDFDGLDADGVRSKIENYQSMSKIPLLIAVDEEGGTVVRVSSNPLLAPEAYKSLQEYYKEGGFKALIDNACEKSLLLKSLGINLNLAPVADVTENPEDFIYDRSFGVGAEETAECVASVVSTMKKEGMGSCLKHFPGYGSNVDTHTGSARDERSLEEFQNADFLPFKSGIDAGADCVLVSHNIVDCLDPFTPASISGEVIKVLRTDLGFNGLVITDDMDMAAVKEYKNPYVQAVKAGDNLIIATDFEAGVNEIREALKSGELSEEEIDAAIQRTLDYKNQNIKDGN